MIYTNVYIIVYTMIYTIIVMVYTIVYTIFLLYIYHGIYHGIYHLPISYIPWYIPKVVYTTFGVVYTMRQPSTGRCGPALRLPVASDRLSEPEASDSESESAGLGAYQVIEPESRSPNRLWLSRDSPAEWIGIRVMMQVTGEFEQ
jgi:hypothetical protein